jgi:hypothetical protein
MINAVIKEEQEGKRPLNRLRLRWEDCAKREDKTVNPGANWRERSSAEDRIRWRNICYIG